MARNGRDDALKREGDACRDEPEAGGQPGRVVEPDGDDAEHQDCAGGHPDSLA